MIIIYYYLFYCYLFNILLYNIPSEFKFKLHNHFKNIWVFVYTQKDVKEPCLLTLI